MLQFVLSDRAATGTPAVNRRNKVYPVNAISRAFISVTMPRDAWDLKQYATSSSMMLKYGTTKVVGFKLSAALTNDSLRMLCVVIACRRCPSLAMSVVDSSSPFSSVLKHLQAHNNSFLHLLLAKVRCTTCTAELQTTRIQRSQ